MDTVELKIQELQRLYCIRGEYDEVEEEIVKVQNELRTAIEDRIDAKGEQE